MEILIREHEPEKLILFGSVAQGEIHEWSDLDLVVIKRTDKPLLEGIVEVIRLVGPTVGLDVLVYAPGDLDDTVRARRGVVLDESSYHAGVEHGRGGGDALRRGV